MRFVRLLFPLAARLVGFRGFGRFGRRLFRLFRLAFAQFGGAFRLFFEASRRLVVVVVVVCVRIVRVLLVLLVAIIIVAIICVVVTALLGPGFDLGRGVAGRGVCGGLVRHAVALKAVVAIAIAIGRGGCDERVVAFRANGCCRGILAGRLLLTRGGIGGIGVVILGR